MCAAGRGGGHRVRAWKTRANRDPPLASAPGKSHRYGTNVKTEWLFLSSVDLIAHQGGVLRIGIVIRLGCAEQAVVAGGGLLLNGCSR